MDCVYDAVISFFSELFPDFLSHEDGSRSIIFGDSKPVRKRYLDGGCEYELEITLAFREYFGRDGTKNSANRREQERLMNAVLSSRLPVLPNGAQAMTLDVTELSLDCVDIRNETARYCVGCRLTFFAEGSL